MKNKFPEITSDDVFFLALTVLSENQVYPPSTSLEFLRLSLSMHCYIRCIPASESRQTRTNAQLSAMFAAALLSLFKSIAFKG